MTSFSSAKIGRNAAAESASRRKAVSLEDALSFVLTVAFQAGKPEGQLDSNLLSKPTEHSMQEGRAESDAAESHIWQQSLITLKRLCVHSGVLARKAVSRFLTHSPANAGVSLVAAQVVLEAICPAAGVPATRTATDVVPEGGTQQSC